MFGYMFMCYPFNTHAPYFCVEKSGYSTKLAVKNAFLDHCLIKEAGHVGPLQWKNDHPAFMGASGKVRVQIGSLAR